MEYEAEATQHRATVERILEKMDRGFGISYESKATWNIAGILGRHISIRGVRILKGPHIELDPNFVEQLEGAEAAGVVTEQESDELWLSDLIVCGTRRSDKERVYVAVKATITANEVEVNRAADRAEILRKVTGRPVTPVVITSRMEKSCREAAARRGVETAICPE